MGCIAVTIISTSTGHEIEFWKALDVASHIAVCLATSDSIDVCTMIILAVE